MFKINLRLNKVKLCFLVSYWISYHQIFFLISFDHLLTPMSGSRQSIWVRQFHEAGVRGRSQRSDSISCQRHKWSVFISSLVFFSLPKISSPISHQKLVFLATIFAYGQTSSGKTYTMSGITEYTVADIFNYINKVT